MKQHAWRIVKWASLTISAGSVVLAVILMWLEAPTELNPIPANKYPFRMLCQQTFYIRQAWFLIFHIQSYVAPRI